MSASITLSRAQLQDITLHCTSEHPREAVGVLTRDGRLVRLRNIDPAPSAGYAVGRDELVGLYRRLDAEGDDIVMVYHSHTGTPAIPSARDREHGLTGVVYLIVSTWDRTPLRTRAWLFDGPAAEEIPLRVTP